MEQVEEPGSAPIRDRHVRVRDRLALGEHLIEELDCRASRVAGKRSEAQRGDASPRVVMDRASPSAGGAIECSCCHEGARHQAAIEPELLVEVGHEFGAMSWQMDVERAETTERLEVHNSSYARSPEAVLDAAVIRSSRDMAEQHAGGDAAGGCDVRCVRSWAPVAM